MPTLPSVQDYTNDFIGKVDPYSGLTQGEIFGVQAAGTPSVSTTEAPKSPVSVLSTDKARGVLQSGIETHTTDMASISGTTDTATKGGLTGQSDPNRDEDPLGLNEGTEPVDDGTANLTAQFDADSKAVESAFGKQLAGMDAATQRIVSGLRSIYSARIGEQKESNRRSMAAYSTSGIRGGASRYAGEIQTGILNEEERQGLKRIEDIAAQEAAAIAQAQMALEDKKYSAFIDKRNELKSLKNDYRSELIRLQGIAQKKKDEEDERKRVATRDAAISGVISNIGHDDPVAIMKELRKAGFDEVGYKDVAAITDSLREAEESAPGIVGEYLAAVKRGVVPKDWTVEDYLNLKDPGRALELELKREQINKIRAEISESGAAAGTSAEEVLAYANQYASTGQIPAGLPKGTFGVVAKVAKESPKAQGSIVNKITNVTDTKVGATEQADFSKLVNIVENVKKLQVLDQKRLGGLTGGVIGTVFGQDEISQFMTLRKAIIDDMQRMQSGAALTPEEVDFYEGYLPGRFTDTGGMNTPLGNIFFEDSNTRLSNFSGFINDRLTQRLDTNNLAVHGYSKVDIGGQKFTVGQMITNESGQIGRVNPDGSVTLIEE